MGKILGSKEREAMTKEEVLQSLAVQTESKLVMVVIDGIGGLPVRGKTELEAAKTPN